MSISERLRRSLLPPRLSQSPTVLHRLVSACDVLRNTPPHLLSAITLVFPLQDVQDIRALQLVLDEQCVGWEMRVRRRTLSIKLRRLDRTQT